MLTNAFAPFENTINSLKHCKEHTEWKKIKWTSNIRSYSTGEQEKIDFMGQHRHRLMRG